MSGPFSPRSVVASGYTGLDFEADNFLSVLHIDAIFPKSLKYNNSSIHDVICSNNNNKEDFYSVGAVTYACSLIFFWNVCVSTMWWALC